MAENMGPSERDSVTGIILNLQSAMQASMHDMELRINKSLADQEQRININLDAKHKENRIMHDASRDSIQNIVNANFLSQQELARKVDRNADLMRTICGDDGESGRMGKIEKTVEVLKQFRWQALAVIAVSAWAVEHFAARVK